MSIDEELDNFIQKNENFFEDKKYIYVPYEDKKNEGNSLIIAMSTHNFGERYFFLKTLIANQKCSLLFIKDPLNTYYLENDGGQSYKRLLEPFVKKYGENNISFFGSSMAGYAALHFGLYFNTNIIVSNPQIDFEISYKYAWDDLRKTLDRVKKNWVDIRTILDNKALDTIVYYDCGDYPMDIENLKYFKKLDAKRFSIYLNKLEDDKHGFYFKNSENIFRVHENLVLFRNFVKLAP